MPNTGFLMLGAMALFYLMRGEGVGTQKPGTLASLLGADISSSGIGGFGSAPTNLDPPELTPVANFAILSGNMAVQAVALDVTGGIPMSADNLTPAAPEIAGTLSALFEAQGVTISEISGNAVRQVGIVSPYDKDLGTSNNPQIGFVDLSVAGVHGAPLMIDDEPIQVLPSAGGTPNVVTLAGGDYTTTVTSGKNLSSLAYYTTTNTLIEALNQGYFDTPTAYVPQTYIQIEQSWAESAEGIASKAAAQTEVSEAYAYVAASQDNWWGEG